MLAARRQRLEVSLSNSYGPAKWHIAAIFVITSAVLALAREAELLIRAATHQEMSAFAFAGFRRTLSELPNHVPFEQGKLTLWADFENRNTETGVPIYVINASKESIKFSAQDGDIYLKLEFLDLDGRWRRAQSHLYSWCGNSYHEKPNYPAQSWAILSGYSPSSGVRRRVRYSLYRQAIVLHTNESEGLIHPEDVEAAQRDGFPWNRIGRDGPWLPPPG